MIITRTPLRISFFGGGTDLPDFYRKDYGAVLGIGINRHVYVLVNERFESTVRASYSQTEIVESSDKVRHNLIREGLLHFGIRDKIEVVTVADIPSTGTGLGSSSSTLVGLLNALSSYVNNPLEKDELAEISSDIEINKMSQPIGKQDQYFAAFGGVSYFRFNEDDTVSREKIQVSKNTVTELEENLICFYTGIGRDSSKILSKQSADMESKRSIMMEMRDQAEEGKEVIRHGDLVKFGQMLNHGWNLKKQLAKGITNNAIDAYYQRGLEAGALGGKLSGAGGGGFITFYCEKEHQKTLRGALAELTEMKIKVDRFGSMIIAIF